MSDSQISPWLTPLVYFVCFRLIVPLYFKSVDIAGQEHLPQKGAVIFAPTHRSRWDAILLAYAAGRWVTGRDLRYMVLSNQTTGIQGWFVKRLGGFPVNRDNPGSSTIRYSLELLKQEETLVLFPEGHIFLEDEIQPIQSGVARISLQALSQKPDLELNIVPIRIRYDRPAPITKGSSVRIIIGSPLSVNDYLQESSKKAAKQLTEDLETALKRLD